MASLVCGGHITSSNKFYSVSGYLYMQFIVSPQPRPDRSTG